MPNRRPTLASARLVSTTSKSNRDRRRNPKHPVPKRMPRFRAWAALTSYRGRSSPRRSLGSSCRTFRCLFTPSGWQGVRRVLMQSARRHRLPPPLPSGAPGGSSDSSFPAGNFRKIRMVTYCVQKKKLVHHCAVFF